MIKSLYIENIKGQTKTQEFTGMDIFIGPNGCGKTTLLQGLKIGMLGYIPEFGKTSPSTFKVATGDNMKVEISTVGDFKFGRSYVKLDKFDAKAGVSKTTITESVDISPSRGEGSETAKKARIEEEIGNFPVMLDFNEFLSLSDAKRREFIYSLSPISSVSWDREKVKEFLQIRLLRPDLKTQDPDQYIVMNELIEQAIKQYPETADIQAGISFMIEWAKSQKKYWDEIKKDSLGAVKKISEIKTQLQETERNIAAYKRELDELQENLIQIEKSLSHYEGKYESLGLQKGKKEQIERELTQMNASPMTGDTQAIEEQIAQLKGKKTTFNYKEKEEVLVSKRETLLSKHEELNKTVTELKEKKTHAEAEVRAYQKNIEAANGVGGKCVVHQLIKCDKDFSPFVSHMNGKKSETEQTVAQWDTEIQKLSAELQEIVQEGRTIKQEIEGLLSQARKVDEENNQIDRKVNELERQKDRQVFEFEKWSEKKKNLEAQMEEFKKAEGSAPSEEITKLQEQGNGIRTRIEEVKTLIQQKEKAKQATLLQQQSLMDSQKAEYRSNAAKALNEALGAKGIKGELVKEILHPIQQSIYENLKLMGYDHQPFFQTEDDNQKEVFQFGWVNKDNHHVNFDALSTGQQTIYLAAMMMTIIDCAQPKLKLLAFDDMNHLDANNFQLVINGLSKLKSKVDNIILCGAISYPFHSEGWKVWDYGAALEQAI